MDLLSLVLHLRPLKAPNGAVPPAWWGRAAQALLLDAVRSTDPALAERIHGDGDTRPYTVSTLIGPSTRAGLSPENGYRLRMTAFREDVAAVLAGAAAEGRLSVSREIELDHLPFRIEAAHGRSGEDPWAAGATYRELGGPFLLANEQPDRRVTLRFTSPTTFKSQGKHVPLPLPELVFGSLLERWNACAPIALPDELKRYAAECLVVSRYRLSSRMVEVKGGGRRVGAVGQATYVTLNYDRYWMSLVQTLARFALFSGIGAGTTMGLGQARMLAGD
jgi:CRISPR-associated endoribonuclease Cas6